MHMQCPGIREGLVTGDFWLYQLESDMPSAWEVGKVEHWGGNCVCNSDTHLLWLVKTLLLNAAPIWELCSTRQQLWDTMYRLQHTLPRQQAAQWGSQQWKRKTPCQFLTHLSWQWQGHVCPIGPIGTPCSYRHATKALTQSLTALF